MINIINMLIKHVNTRKTYTLIFALTIFSSQYIHTKNQTIKTPKLTVVIIADQFAYHYIERLSPHFKYGVKELLDHGICYENAYHPHGNPETSPGHNAISTGTLPKDHGIVSNQWINRNNKHICYASPDQTLVDGLSDQFMLKSTNKNKHHTISLSLKQRSAIATASKLGSALWLDNKNGHFKSSRRYFEELPTWLTKFNKNQKLKPGQEIIWKTLYPENGPEYEFPQIKNYTYSALGHGLTNTPIKVFQNQTKPRNNAKNNGKNKYHEDLFFLTPQASQLIFDAAKEYINHIFEKKNNDNAILWLCLSNLDLLCHLFGPDSRESIDLVYHLDKQILNFMSFIQKKAQLKDTLFIFTSDHGIQPIPEITKAKGLPNACRIMATPLIESINKHIQKKYNLKKTVKIVKSFSMIYFYLNHELLNAYSKKTQNAIKQDIKKYLLKQPGIRHVWTKQELAQAHFEPYEKECFYQNQLYQARTGDLIYMPHPYCLITDYPTGCSHTTPYDYDTHVPLILYQKGLKHKIIREKVFIPQLPVTLARLLNLARPSASTYNILPGVTD
ncbi:MAG: alkaline phosphatase family protein [bacterium]